MREASFLHKVPHGGATEGVSQADELLGSTQSADSEWSAGGAIPPATNKPRLLDLFCGRLAVRSTRLANLIPRRAGECWRG